MLSTLWIPSRITSLLLFLDSVSTFAYGDGYCHIVLTDSLTKNHTRNLVYCWSRIYMAGPHHTCIELLISSQPRYKGYGTAVPDLPQSTNVTLGVHQYYSLERTSSVQRSVAAYRMDGSSPCDPRPWGSLGIRLVVC